MMMMMSGRKGRKLGRRSKRRFGLEARATLLGERAAGREWRTALQPIFDLDGSTRLAFPAPYHSNHLQLSHSSLQSELYQPHHHQQALACSNFRL